MSRPASGVPAAASGAGRGAGAAATASGSAAPASNAAASRRDRHIRQGSRSFDELDLVRSSSHSSLHSPTSASSSLHHSAAPTSSHSHLRRRSLGAIHDHLAEQSMELKEEEQDHVGVLSPSTGDSHSRRSSKLQFGKKFEQVSDSMERGAKKLANTLSGENERNAGKNEWNRQVADRTISRDSGRVAERNYRYPSAHHAHPFLRFFSVVLRSCPFFSTAAAKLDMMETLNYDNIMDLRHEIEIETDSKSKRHDYSLTVLKFLVTITIALFTAILYYAVSNLVLWAFHKRVDFALDLIADGKAAGAYFWFIFASLALTAVSSSLVAFVAPPAKGGGVPYAMAYLNGTNVSNFFTLRVVAVKALALGFAIAGGLTVGMEGPFVYLGGGIALLLSRTIDSLPAFQTNGKYTRILRNIKEERVFMAGGLAAGLAVAFNAPVAGILFAMEGATAFLTVPVTLRIFGCSMFAMFFSALAKAGFSYNVKSTNIITITASEETLDYVWIVPEIIAFTLMAALGGVLGAAATRINVMWTKWRHHNMEGKVLINMGEVALITWITSTIWFILPFIFSCKPLPLSCSEAEASGEESMCIQAMCAEGFYSEIASITYSPADVVSKILFSRTVESNNEYSPAPLLVYGICYFFLVSWVYGAYVPGGLFVPSVVIGGVYGRLFGWIGHVYISNVINPGVYALLGAAGMLGGFTRLALPVVIMLAEMTGDATYLLPIMYVATLANSSLTISNLLSILNTWP